MARILTQDRITALACMALGAAALVAIPYQTSNRPIPGARGFDVLDGAFFPKIAVALFLVAAIWLFFEGRLSRRRGAEAVRPEDEVDADHGISPQNFLWALTLTGAFLLYVQFLDAAGYLAATIVGVIALAWICGLRSLIGTLFVGLVYPVAVYLLFSRLFMVPLPRGDLWFG